MQIGQEGDCSNLSSLLQEKVSLPYEVSLTRYAGQNSPWVYTVMDLKWGKFDEVLKIARVHYHFVLKI